MSVQESSVGRRVRILRLEKRFLIDVLNWQADCLQELRLPTVEGLPWDARVTDIQFDWEAATLCAMVEHESFDLVPFGLYPEAFAVRPAYVRVIAAECPLDAIPR